MKPDGDRGVQSWLDEQIAETLYITSISLSELLLGVELLPDGKRKEGLAEALSDLLVTLFGHRVLSFDLQAATVYAGRVSKARAAERAISLQRAESVSAGPAQVEQGRLLRDPSG